MLKKTKTQTLIDQGYKLHSYKNRNAQLVNADYFKKQGRIVELTITGKKPNYKYNVLVKQN